ncbi:bifunctional SulP family inorganic anion transporter/carbonic anhydrase [Streptomyces sp. HPF1205]|uniref:bifunctional SulP family inorganic anion transporter/carbonic anhydrase n=1 Tax=Streptomyces sp. HPF1205 TaxID=2873262 RepID=UPI001CEDA018|nr:SulP family inorganic anion transporter [Streptomyces sp. HPF1205]
MKVHRSDLSASITVFLIAVPLSLGIAAAAGAPPQAGLIAAAVGGLLAGPLGGAPLQVSGAAAALVVVTADLVHRYGWRATCAVTVLAGLAQMLVGSLRAARAALALGPAVVRGTLAGIGAVITLGQVYVVLGGSARSTALRNIEGLPEQVAHARPTAVAIGALTAAVLLGWPRLKGRFARLGAIPAPLAAVALATAVSAGQAVPRATPPVWSTPVLPTLPSGPALGIAAAVLTVALVASMESSLSAVTVDTLRAKRPGPHAPPPADLDRELLGQGAANVVSGLLGGLPVAGCAVRGPANVAAGARTRGATVLHGLWVVLFAGATAGGALGAVPSAALAALVAAVGIHMISFAHIRHIQWHREFPVYAAAAGGVALFGVPQGMTAGIAVAAFLALRRMALRWSGLRWSGLRRPARFRSDRADLADPAHPAVHAGTAAPAAPAAHAGTARHRFRFRVTREAADASSGATAAGPMKAHACRPWTPWRDHRCVRPAASPATGVGPLLGGVSAFQRDTAPLVREELSRLAREGQAPTQLFLTCADSRLVTSMITSSGPGGLFTVRNIGNMMPPPGSDTSCDSVAAAVQYAVEVLRVSSITVCGHSGCGAMQALLGSGHEPGAQTPLARWLRHGRPSLARMGRIGRLGRGEVAVAERPVADDLERLALVNVMIQLDNLMAHPCVARRVCEGTLQLHGMYFHVGEAQAYMLDRPRSVFRAVRPDTASAGGAGYASAPHWGTGGGPDDGPWHDPRNLATKV